MLSSFRSKAPLIAHKENKDVESIRESRRMLIRFAALVICLAESPITAPVANQADLTGGWFMTLSFAGVRPVATVITFLADDAGKQPQPGIGQWERTSDNKFPVAFRLPAQTPEDDSSAEYLVTGLLSLEAFGQLRGPLEAKLLHSNGALMGSVRNIAKANRISPLASE